MHLSYHSQVTGCADVLVSPDLKQHFKGDPSDVLLDKDREEL